MCKCTYIYIYTYICINIYIERESIKMTCGLEKLSTTTSSTFQSKYYCLKENQSSMMEGLVALQSGLDQKMKSTTLHDITILVCRHDIGLHSSHDTSLNLSTLH